jgi:hypothetical protein
MPITGNWMVDGILIAGLLLLGGALGFWLAELLGRRK